MIFNFQQKLLSLQRDSQRVASYMTHITPAQGATMDAAIQNFAYKESWKSTQ